jgi:hypothetical protein
VTVLSGPPPAAAPRARFRRRRLRALAAGTALASAVTGLGVLLVLPHAVASVRLLDLSLGWWGAVLVGVLALGALAVGRDGDR